MILMKKTRVKPKKKPKLMKIPAGWFDRQTMCDLLDISPQHFARKYVPLLPTDAIDTVKTKSIFHGRTLLNAWLDERTEDALKNVNPTGEDDPLLLGGGDRSPALERYRSARADIAELDVQERRKVTVHIDLIRRATAFVVSAPKNAVDSLMKRFGNDAGEMVNEAVAEAVEQIKKVFSGLNGEPGATATDGIRMIDELESNSAGDAEIQVAEAKEGKL